jgi:hypothetical protein
MEQSCYDSLLKRSGSNRAKRSGRPSLSKYRDDAKIAEYEEVCDPLPPVISGAGENVSRREPGARISLLQIEG